MKIAILGYSGSGKSTLCKHLSTYYKVPHLYLDTVKFLPNWIVRSDEERIKILDEFLENDSWVIDGNYSRFRQKERLDEADKIIFLNFNRLSCLFRAYKRMFTYKNKVRDSISDGCEEKIDFKFFWWLLHSGRKKKKRDQFKKIINSYKDKIVVINNQKELDSFLQDYKI
ncbi:MAG: DNA topology modulation protein [Clostridia bacterium]|jgi:adenylate kinase family enzyme|nr:DNA topology modulation protein [Clostridia bacterium]